MNERRVLLQHRAPWVHNGDTWGIPGGARDSHESAFDAALRESAEEIGLDTTTVLERWRHLDDHQDWSYETIVVELLGQPQEFEKNHETLDLRWIDFDEVVLMKLHPSFARNWPEISGQIRDIAD